MPVDTSMYGAPQPPNLMGTLSAAAGIQNALNTNRLFQQEYNSKLGLSQIYKSAIDPTTGQLDTGKLNALLAGPDASNVTLGLPQAYQNSQEAQQRNLDIQQKQLGLAKQHLDTLESYVAPLLAKPNVNSQDIAATMGQAITVGHVNPETAANLFASLPKGPNGQIDESQVPAWLKQQQFRMLTLQQQFEAMNPTPTAVNTGGQTQLTAIPQVGPPHVVGTFANTLPPGTPTVGPGGIPQVIGPTSSGLQVPGGNQSAPSMPQAATSPAPGGLSGHGGVGVGINAPAATGRLQTGLAPGVADAMAHTAIAGADQGVALQKAADAIPQQKAILGNLETALNQFTPGPGSKWTKETAALFNRGLQGLGFKGVAADPVAAQEEFTKQAVNLAQAQFATLGGTGTDAKLDSTMHTSPSEGLSKLGNQKIIQLLKGNADAIAVKNQEWQKYVQAGNSPGDYAKFSTEFNKEYDPRVFQSVYMSPKDWAATVKAMSPSEKTQLRQSYNLAVEKGWIPHPAAGAVSGR